MTSSATDWPDPVPYSELSKRRHEILQYLWTCPSVYSPSFREIGHAVGLTGPSAVRYQIDELEAKSLVTPGGVVAFARESGVRRRSWLGPGACCGAAPAGTGGLRDDGAGCP